MIIGFFVYIGQYLTYFNSAEDAYEQIYSGTVYAVVEGQQTDYVIGNKKQMVLKKTEKGWKKPIVSILTAKSIRKVGTITIQVSQYNFSDEYYVTISDFDKTNPDIKDNYNSQFYEVFHEGEGLDKTIRGYFAYVNQIEDDYTITVNDETINILK